MSISPFEISPLYLLLFRLLLRLLLRLLFQVELAAGFAPPFGFGAILLAAAFAVRLRMIMSFRG